MRSGLLLSGGMDSSALAFMLRPSIAVSIDYGQKSASAEMRASSVISRRLNIQHHVVTIDCSSIGSGQLVGTEPSPHGAVPEWWPFRNQLLLTIAAASVIDFDIQEILIGTVSSDRQHSDGTPEFIAGIDALLALQEAGMRVGAPAVDMTPSELIRKSGITSSLLAWTHSCHLANFACGSCRGCFKRSSTLRDVGFGDP